MNYFSPDARLSGPDGKVMVPDDVQEAVRTLLRWAGEDPTREGLRDTPGRVARAWLEYCDGYEDDPGVHLSRTFEEVGGSDEDRVVGISTLARVLQGYAHRLQVQERLTAEVANCIWEHLQPLGVAVVIEAQHGCMTGRGVRTPGVNMVTRRVLGCFADDADRRKDVFALMGR